MRDLVLERLQAVSPGRSAAVFAGSVTVALALSAFVLIAAGVPAGNLVDEVIVQVFLTADGLAQTVTTAIPLLLVGLSVAAAFRLGFWNIGMEGQLWVGAIAGTAVAVADLGPPELRLAVILLASAIGGAAAIAVPLVLKMRFGVSEVVVSLLLSNICYLLLQHLLFGALRDPAANFPLSPVFDEVERLALIGFGKVHGGLWIALFVAAAAALVVHGSRAGFYARAVGANAAVARAVGLPVAATLVGWVLASGALSGLAGGLIITGTEYRLTQFVGLNMTFSGILVAMLARLDPIGCVAAAFFVAGLYVAGGTLKVFYGVSEGVVLTIQGLFLMTLIVGRFFSTYRITRPARGAATT